jgi:short-subunit dehydrogenase
VILFKIILYKKNKYAIIINPTKGIGKATAALLGKEGFNIVVCSRSQDKLI